MDLNKNMKAMNIILTIAGAVLVTISALVDVWLVVPAYLLAEYVKTKLAKDASPVKQESAQNVADEDTTVLNNEEVVVAKVKPVKEEIKVTEEPRKRTRKKGPKAPEAVQQVKSPKRRRNN